MATSPSQHDEMWRGVCFRELVSWRNPLKEAQAMSQNRNGIMQTPPKKERLGIGREPGSWRFEPGDKVCLTGLSRRLELNGQGAEVLSANTDPSGKVVVRLTLGPNQNKRFRVKAGRMRPVASEGDLLQLSELDRGGISQNSSGSRSRGGTGSTESGGSRRRVGSEPGSSGSVRSQSQSSLGGGSGCSLRDFDSAGLPFACSSTGWLHKRRAKEIMTPSPTHFDAVAAERGFRESFSAAKETSEA